MSATSIASRSTSIIRAATRRSLISPRPRNPSPNPNSSSPPLRQTRIEASSAPRLTNIPLQFDSIFLKKLNLCDFESERCMLRRELSTHQPFHSVVAAACLVSKLPSDLTSYEGNNPQNLLWINLNYMDNTTISYSFLVGLVGFSYWNQIYLVVFGCNIFGSVMSLIFFLLVFTWEKMQPLTVLELSLGCD